MRDLKNLIAAIGLLALAPVAQAAPCAGFTDVDSTSTFCPNVDWIKNRGVTLGCGASTYCPDAPVSRLAMAAFLNRLGTALTPVQLTVDTAPGPLDLDLANNVVCQTANYAVTGYPRRVYVDLSFTASATAEQDFAADLVQSIDNGATWTLMTAQTNRGSVPANHWAGLGNVAQADLAVGQSVKFGVRVSRDGLPGTTDLADSRCKLRAAIMSRDGATSPF
jgi:hypothetical protein